MSDDNMNVKKVGRPKKYFETADEKKDRIRKKMREYQQNRYKIDPEYRVYKINNSKNFYNNNKKVLRDII